jgi:tyrosine-specific transport protein
MNRKGSTLGATLLVSGTCIGGGMLGIPVMTGLAGLCPGLLINVICWLFMLATGLLFLEATLWMPENTNVISMTSRFLGPWGKVLGGISFVFLYYSLMIAYISGGAPFFINAISPYFELSTGAAYTLFTILFATIIYFGARTIDRVNTILMAGLIISYILLVGQSTPNIQINNFSHTNWKYFLLSAPLLFSAYGYHNIIPSISTYLHQDAKRLRIAVVVGTTIPFVIYALWQWIIIGSIPEELIQEALNKGVPITEVLTGYKTWVHYTASLFSFFALTTSLLGVSFSTLDFLSDGLKMRKEGVRRFILCLMVFVPPAVWAAYNPGVFLDALSYAGGFGESILNGLIPVLMVWVGHYYMKLPLRFSLPGGRITLSFLLVITFSIIAVEIIHLAGVI